ncbi:hypothetical protein L227DRAFT_651213 [Lentinus tigrinus ALCF2SS1-6]|uniref:Uncharacterized protein n=1 Tax=Lentinus tigrinus ALCF2SS1-6 TaxID=1328759 RepID=A0A5C2SGM7_9APHY|nr:hypothetical protein L227DRAFT_651213 [Lentinus tigrinus ALCF2SS1-6]
MAGPSGSVLSELLKEPFGPYWENAALTKAAKSTTVDNPLPLKCVTIESGGICTGLSECDPTMFGYDSDRFATEPIRFMGILEIRYLSWLSPEVRKEIEAELRMRDVQARRSPNNPHPQPSNLTLKSLYAPSFGFNGGSHKVKVKIQTTMGESASYLLSGSVFDGLRITSALQIPDTENGHHRSYLVESMFIYTYALSRLYLARWRVLRVVRDIVELDNTDTEEPTPVEERTPDWFVDRYLKYFAYHSSGRQFRAVHTDSDSDIDPETGGRLIKGHEHILRHVSHSEISSLLAEHAEWLIHQTYQTKFRRLFDPDKWREQWLPNVRILRYEAEAAGRRWGVWEGYEEVTEYAMEIDEIPWPASISKGKKKGKKKVTKKSRPAYNATASHSDEDNAMDVDTYFNSTYDPDFSHPSSDDEAPPTTSEEEEDADTGLIPLTDPEIIALIPSSFRHLPPPPASHKWKCTECDYVIDLLNLTQRDLDNPMISYDVRQRLLSKKWNMFTERGRWAYEAFLHMVDKHHAEHLDGWGIAFRTIPGGYVAVWKDGRRPKSSRLRQVQVDNRRQMATVKTEEL